MAVEKSINFVLVQAKFCEDGQSEGGMGKSDACEASGCKVAATGGKSG